MAKELRKIRDARNAQIGIRRSLKLQEERNVCIRDLITPLWDNRENDEKVAIYAKHLVVGRTKVRAYQHALRALKMSIKANNRMYDLNKNYDTGRID